MTDEPRSTARSSGSPSETDTNLRVVGVGASAGGLEAFTALIGALATDTGMAFVVVSHLDPAHPSVLSEILAGSTAMRVVDIHDRPEVAPNVVYVLPPGHDLTLEGSRLLLHPRAAGALHHPIDRFFRSLAEARRDQAIGVVLSGTASDGTLGIRAIKDAGGITFAQDDSARQTGMPHSAIADGFVDYVLSPTAIGAELVRIGHTPRTLHGSFGTTVDEDTHVADILQIVRRGTGVDFTSYKTGTLRRRVLRRMILNRVDRLADYAELLRTTPGEARALHDDLLIGVTSFFRDPDAFAALGRTAFRRLFDAQRDSEPVRVWVLGCSTGEEAYSLAMALTEAAEAIGRSVPLQVFASDVNAAGIEVARAGVYPADIAQDVSAERLERFFVRVDDHYRVVRAIRDICVFSRHNVLSDPPFSRIDLVSCRNLLMYLEPPLQQDVIKNLHYALKSDGVLWLGSADSVGGHTDLFDPLDAQHKVFGRRPGSVSHPVLRMLSSRLSRPDGVSSGTRGHGGPVNVLKESDRLLLNRFSPAGVVVSAAMDVLQYRGDIGPYIAPLPGKASLNLMQVLDRRLHVAVRAAIARARRDMVAVREEDVRLFSPDGRGEHRVSLEVVPIGTGPDGFLILLDDESARSTTVEAPSAATGATSSDEAASLERVSKELADTQTYLHAMIEEHEAARSDLESAHEEAQSANEELQSINEELETSKEEIQSANEELTTLNDELQHRNKELQSTNNDLANLLASTDLAVVFLGPGLLIRRFTAAASRLLNLRPADVGRPIGELRVNLSVDLHDQVVHTLQTLETTEQNAQTVDGRWFSLRTRPYRTLDNQIDGVVLFLVDVDDVVRARLYAESIIATGRAPLIVLDERLVVVTANDAFHRTFGSLAATIEGRPFFEISGRLWDVPSLRTLLERLLPQNHVVRDLEVTTDTGGRHRVWLLDARRLQQAEGNHPLILLSLEDVSERQHAEGLRQQRVTELAAADQSKNEFLAMLAHELRNPLAAIRNAAEIVSAPSVPVAVTERARHIIDRQLRNMVRLIDDLLDVSRITQGQLALEVAPVELGAVLRQAAEVISTHVKERRQRLTLQIDDAPIYAMGDATRLEQAFGNLLSNASKFSPAEGGIDVRVRLDATTQGGEALIYVTDTGVGIEPSLLPHVFDLFRQGSGSPHRVPGLGVGLALVKQILALHGGRVSVSSLGPGHGSEFVVALPLMGTAPLEAGHRREAAATPLDLQRILVVDDNPDAADSLTALLQAYGHEVRTAYDGEAALELAAVFQPSVAFLDIEMPNLNGYELAARLRRLPGCERALLIALTGYGRDEDRRLAREAGFDRHVTKPMDPQLLAGLISRADAERGDGS